MLGTRLKELRKERGLTQQQVANVLSISARGYTYYELGTNEPSLSALKKLSDFFNCSIDYLVGREDDFGNITIQNENAAPALTDEERRWLEKYRKLDFGNKLSVNGYIDAQLDYQEKHKNWKL